ncbi:hypothetical protein MTR67_006077, partial [Solanum verrucosum]
MYKTSLFALLLELCSEFEHIPTCDLSLKRIHCKLAIVSNHLYCVVRASKNQLTKKSSEAQVGSKDCGITLSSEGPRYSGQRGSGWDDGLNNFASLWDLQLGGFLHPDRQGFALGMAVLVCAVPYMNVDVLLKSTVELLEISSSMRVRDCLKGHLFAYGDFARSGKLILEWISDKNIPYSKELVGSRLFGNKDTDVAVDVYVCGKHGLPSVQAAER